MQVVVRALSVLRELAPRPGGLGLADLAARLDVPQGSMHRLLAVLEGEHFVSRSPSNRRYFLGPAARQLTEDNTRHNALLVTPHPAIAVAAQHSGETVFLTELIGNRAVCVSLVESRHPLRLFVQVGQAMPLHAAASARALLADRDPDEIRRLCATRSLTPYTAETVTDVEVLIEHLAVVRARGYDVCDDELEHGVWAVSAPVRASTGRVVASVTMAAPAYRVGSADLRSGARETVLSAASAMAADLGWVEPPLPGGDADSPAAPVDTLRGADR